MMTYNNYTSVTRVTATSHGTLNKFVTFNLDQLNTDALTNIFLWFSDFQIHSSVKRSQLKRRKMDKKSGILELEQ